jgi:hypothetical protein
MYPKLKINVYFIFLNIGDLTFGITLVKYKIEDQKCYIKQFRNKGRILLNELDAFVNYFYSYSRYSDGRRGKKFFCTPQSPDRLWGPPSLVSSAYLGLLPRGISAEALF